MNVKELETLVLEQGRQLQEARDKSADQGQLEQLQEDLQEARDYMNGMNDTLASLVGLQEAFQEHRTLMLAGLGEVNQAIGQLQNWIGADDIDGPFGPEFKALTARVTQLETLVLARNASAATKRNMTDEDAYKVLTGDLKDLSHKEAAEKAGLTYAQVYSCRLEFTFKHVHKDLRDNHPEWKNTWAK